MLPPSNVPRDNVLESAARSTRGRLGEAAGKENKNRITPVSKGAGRGWVFRTASVDVRVWLRLVQCPKSSLRSQMSSVPLRSHGPAHLAVLASLAGYTYPDGGSGKDSGCLIWKGIEHCLAPKIPTRYRYRYRLLCHGKFSPAAQ